MHPELGFVILFAIATVVAIVARRLRIPYTVALVLAGLGLNAVHAFTPPRLTKELLFAVILPGLLFEAAFQIGGRQFWKNKLAINALAVPGVAVAVALTAALLTPAVRNLHLLEGFDTSHALLFSAIVAATDPIAVVGIFKSLGAPKRLAVLVEGESLLNDGTGVVLFTIVLQMIGGGTFSLGDGVVSFVRIAGAGALVGAAIGWALSKLIERIDDAMIEITLTVLAAYGSFVIAEQFHFSGVIATVVAGMLCGDQAPRGMTETTRASVHAFWEYVAFALNSIVFLLVGTEIDLGRLVAIWPAILTAYGCVLAARAIVVGGVSLLLVRTRERIPTSWSAVVVWSGLRGALSMVLVLSVPADFPLRETLVDMTYGVVVLSILLQGVSMRWLLQYLRIGEEGA